MFRVVIQFSETMDTNTINSSTFFLTPSGGSPVSGVILFHGSNFVSFDAASPLRTGTTYTVTVTSGAKNLAGVGISPPLASTFTTKGSPDVTPPTVTSVSPVNAATNVPVNAAVTVTFSEAMTAATVNT